MTKPKRVQRKRTKGFHLPEGAVSVTRPGRWGNPFPIGPEHHSREETMRLFRQYAEERMRQEPDWLEPLRGRDLACYCKPDEACHADILLELLNRD